MSGIRASSAGSQAALLPRMSPLQPRNAQSARNSRMEARGAVEPITIEEPMNRSSSGFGTSDCCKLFVGGIAAQTTTEALRVHFSRYGCIVDAVVMNKNGRPRGFGFVTFDAPAAAAAVLTEQQWLDGRLVDVKRAVPGERNQERTSNKIFVGGLPQDVSTDDLRAYFSGYGAVADAVVMVDRRTSRSRGFGFVRFAGGAQGCAASEAVLRDFPTHRLGGKWVEVKRATPAALLQAAGELSPSGSGMDIDLTSPTAMAFLDQSDFYMDPSCWAAMGMGTPTGASALGEDGFSGTPMSAGSTLSPLNGGSRGRRGRRRKQRGSGNGDDENGFYCDAYGEAFDQLDANSPDEHSGEDYSGLMGDHMLGAPLGLSQMSQNVPRLGHGLNANIVGSSKFKKGYEGNCENSENNPGRANNAENCPPGLFAGANAEPMKVRSSRMCASAPGLIEAPPGLGGLGLGDGPENSAGFTATPGEGFTREDFLSIEVRPWLSAW